MKKEKSDKQMSIMVQPSLHEEFEKKCNEEHRTVSEVIRELMSKHVSGFEQVSKRKVVYLDVSSLSSKEQNDLIDGMRGSLKDS